MTLPDDIALTPPAQDDEPVDHLPDTDPGTAGIDPDTQGGDHHPSTDPTADAPEGPA